MEKIISFVVNNWKLCAYCVLVIIHFVLLFVRKKPVKVIDGVKDSIWSILPALIIDAEKTYPEPGKGAEKGQYVISGVWKFLHDEYGLQDFDIYSDFIKSAVEYILSTPQKKGD